MIASAYFFTVSGSKVERALLILLNIPVLCYQVLSGSRNAQLALYLCLFLGVGITCIKGTLLSGAGRHRGLKALMIAFATVAAAHLIFFAIMRVAEHVPAYFDDYSGTLAHKIPVDESTRADEEGEPEGKLLERIDTRGNITTNRTKIWRDYLSLWSEYGLLGLSSTYDQRYMQVHHPDLFICVYYRDRKPGEYAAGKVYHPHNGYLKTWVSTGYLGFALLMLFLIGSVRDVWKALRRPGNVSPQLLFPLLIVVAGCSAAMFDLELFFIFNSVSYIFWLAAGILMKQVGIACVNNVLPD